MVCGSRESIPRLVKEIEDRREIQTQLPKKLLDGNNSLNADEPQDLGQTSIPSYRLSSFKEKYPHYCGIAYDFACKTSYSAQAYVGTVSRDWHPLGFSQSPRADRCNLPVPKYCEFKDWTSAKNEYSSSFGSRVFLIRNLEIKNIPGRILIDFENPSDQLIPDIGKR
jgi:hypothetical protein